MKNWNYKVVKMSRGCDGQWFAHRAAAAFETFAEACDYARDFHAEQQADLGVTDGHKYCVLARKNGGEQKMFRLATPAEYYANEIALAGA